MQSIERRLAVLEELATDRSTMILVLEAEETEEQCRQRAACDAVRPAIFISPVDELL